MFATSLRAVIQVQALEMRKRMSFVSAALMLLATLARAQVPGTGVLVLLAGTPSAPGRSDFRSCPVPPAVTGQQRLQRPGNLAAHMEMCVQVKTHTGFDLV